VTCTAGLADGTKLSQAGWVAKDGRWPFYAPLYRGRGQLLGWLTFSNSEDPPLAGQASWIKGTSSSSIYADGFNLLTTTLGSAYQPPSRGVPILDVSDGSIAFRGATARDSFTNYITIAPNNRVSNLSDNKLTMTFSPASGLFRGSVVDPDGSRRMPFGGVVLQNQNMGSGFFMMGSKSGRVDLNGQ